MHRTWIFVILAALIAWPSAASAQQPARRGRGRGGAPAAAPAAAGAPGAAGQPQAPPQTLSLAEAREALRSNDPVRIRQGVDALTVVGTGEVIPPLVELLRSGPSDEITDYVVEKLEI